MASAILDCGLVSEALGLSAPAAGAMFCPGAALGCCPCCGDEFDVGSVAPLGVSLVSILSDHPANPSADSGGPLPTTVMLARREMTHIGLAYSLVSSVHRPNKPGLFHFVPPSSRRALIAWEYRGLSPCVPLGSGRLSLSMWILPIASFYALFYKPFQAVTSMHRRV